MPAFYRVIFIVFLAICCRGQTVTPLIIATSHNTLCHNTEIPFEIQDGDSLSSISYSMVPISTWTIWPILKGDKFTITFRNPGTFSLYISAQDPDGTVRTGSTTLFVLRKAEASFNASLTSHGYPNELVLTSYSENFQGLLWRFSDGSTDTLEHVHRPYSASGTQSVELIAYGQNGCNDTSTYEFYIEDSSGVTLPNIFTPNNDGVNDVYRPIARGILHLSARIFNRDQVLLHSWDTVRGFWDGHTTSGSPCPPGVYFIVVDAIGFDNKKYTLTGSITLLR